MANGMNGTDLVSQNLYLREQLRATSYYFRKYLGAFTTGNGANALGATLRIKLYNVGLITRLMLRVRTLVDIGVEDATLSPKGPFNLFNNLKLTDYDGTDRINVQGHILWQMNCVRRRTAWGFNNESQANVLVNPNVGLTVGADRPLEFFMEVPLAYDEVDLRGMLLAQTAVGEVYLTLTTNSVLISNGNADAVFNGGATTTAVIDPNTPVTVEVWQDYIYPQSLDMIPPLDVSTVYELIGNINSSDNIAAGTEKLISYPNLRSVIGYYTNYVNNGVMNPGTDLTGFRLIVNGNNIMQDNDEFSTLFNMREYLNSDMRPGMYFHEYRRRPIETALFGNVQLGFTPSTVNAGNTKLELGVESFYAKGLALPGVPQGT